MSSDVLELRMYNNLIRENRLNNNIPTRKKKQWALNCEKHIKQDIDKIKLCQYCNKEYKYCYCLNDL